MRDYKLLLKSKLIDYLPSETRGYNFEFPMTGTGAIDFALNEILLRAPNICDVFLPDFGCYCLELPFKRHNLIIHKYQIKFNYDTRTYFYDIPQIDHGIVLVCDYFYPSFDFPYQTKKDVFYIRDITHTLFNFKFKDDHYYVASLRKWFHSADGGIFFTKQKILSRIRRENKKYNFNKKLDYFFGKFNCMIAKKLQNSFSIKADFYGDNDFSGYHMSTSSSRIVLKTDIGQMIANRAKNYNLLKKSFAEFNVPNGTMLFTFPIIYKKEINVPLIIDQLREMGIRCAQMWENNICPLSNNICFDLSKDYSNYQISKILNKLRMQ